MPCETILTCLLQFASISYCREAQRSVHIYFPYQLSLEKCIDHMLEYILIILFLGVIFKVLLELELGLRFGFGF